MRLSFNPTAIIAFIDYMQQIDYHTYLEDGTLAPVLIGEIAASINSYESGILGDLNYPDIIFNHLKSRLRILFRSKDPKTEYIELYGEDEYLSIMHAWAIFLDRSLPTEEWLNETLKHIGILNTTIGNKKNNVVSFTGNVYVFLKGIPPLDLFYYLEAYGILLGMVDPTHAYKLIVKLWSKYSEKIALAIIED